MTALAAASGGPGVGKPSTNSVEKFGHFVNATLLQETRSFIIATLRGKVIAMQQYRNTNSKSNWKSR